MDSHAKFLKTLSENLKKSDMNKPQIVAKTVIDAVNAGVFALGEAIPSIHKVSDTCLIARETIRQAYNILKRKGVVGSKRGRSFYTICERYTDIPNVFLMFNYFGTPHKVETLRGIMAGVGDKAKLSFFSHYKNPDTFAKTLADAKGKYDYYVVMPLRDKKCADALADFDQSKLLLIDIDIDFPNKNCPKIIQNFDENFLKILRQLAPDIEKYAGFKLVMVLNSAPEEHARAFKKFCTERGLNGEIRRTVSENDVHEKTIWIVFNDDDLVTVIKRSDELGLKIRSDYAVISYNDIPFKHIVYGGITTISIDFFDLGKRVAAQILDWDETRNETVPTFLVRGNTL